MKVKVAKTAGFCMGVKRAMDIALEAARSSRRPIYTLGPLIHNPQVLEILERRGVGIVRDVNSIQGGTVIVRAHGIAPQERQVLLDKGVEIADATCPHVLRVQSIIMKHVEKGYTCIIVGDKGHAEVVGLLGFAMGKGHVVERLENVDNIPASEKMIVVAQTTQDREFYEKVCEALSKRFSNICIFDTICNSTAQRQAEVQDLARQVDAMIVVGGRNSANTNRLVNIAKSTGRPTFHVERAAELDANALRSFRVVGVTAGASTPTWLINEVVDYVRSIAHTPTERLWKAWTWILQLLLVTCVFPAVGAACLNYASAVLMGVQPQWLYALTAASAVWGLHLLNRVLEKDEYQACAPLFPAFYPRHQYVLALIAICAVAVALFLAATQGWGVLGLLAACCVAGVVYRLKIIPKPIEKLIGRKSLQEIPATKELFLATAWTVVAAIPAAVGEAGWQPASFVAAAFVFGLVFLRAVALDVREIQWDAIMGRDTISTVFGLFVTKVICALVTLGLTALLLMAGMFEWTAPVAFILLINPAYAAGYLYFYHRRWITGGVSYEGIVDANFILAGLLTFLYHGL